ncbi:hypothetical protein EA462_03160 [Natrarchaeobius halalkaliphilus]|uniref:Uncharacterized protein n=1 Tax=Natrarchaeobius halalkaliphilus TaxID=1679091 RepID=A0A3N6LT54_9EURY|nr:Sjogren's syndrome/scleroderma autoantigen 1 family protein [Natrarchaeobius halalkaliphilus]RQG93208.1 hypothetical protein EA462_03160 [Natrarchaeobius halalkaliphilus]
MSDFDKEAEREKLREKYERDKQEREATQRMSDLLLKGATMTNTHCGTCGDPLFQQEGTTFCPSCHGNADAVEGTNLDGQPTDEPSAGGNSGGSAGSGSEDVNTSPARRAADEPPTARRTGDQAPAVRSADGEPTTQPAGETAETTTPRGGEDPKYERRSTGGSESHDRGGASHPSSDETASRGSSLSQSVAEGDCETARDSLVRALERFSREAADTDDPRYAKECLEAAREASETLNALR